MTKNLDKSVINDREALKRLKKVYLNRKALRLFMFYKLDTSPKINDRAILKNNYNPSTIWRNRKNIANAKVGLPNHSKSLSFDLEIPSKLVVNVDPRASSASAEQLRGI